MKKLGLKKRLVNYLQRVNGWVHSGTLQELTKQHTDQMPRTAVRRLQEAVEEGLIEVKYEKGSALYRFKRAENSDVETPYRIEIDEERGVAVQVYEKN